MDDEVKRVIETSAVLSSLHLVAQIVLAQCFLQDKPGLLRAYEVVLRKTKYETIASPNAPLAFEIQTATLEAHKVLFRHAAAILGIEEELAEVESNLGHRS